MSVEKAATKHASDETTTFGDPEACLLRDATNTTSLVETARAVAQLLARFDIPHLIVGGLAVQEHGYARTTIDVDVVVPDVLEAVEILTSDITGPFHKVSGCDDRVVDQRRNVKVDLLPAGRVLRIGCEVPFPEPDVVSDVPRLISLPQLISLKLDSSRVNPLLRMKDKADVVELIKARAVPRDLPVAAPVKKNYEDIWDGLQTERARM